MTDFNESLTSGRERDRGAGDARGSRLYFADRHPLPVLIFTTSLIYLALYSRFLFGKAVFMYSDIGSDSLSTFFPTFMMLSRLLKEGALGSYTLTYGLGGSTAFYALQSLNPLKFLPLPFSEAYFPVVILIHQFLIHILTALTGYGLFSRLFRDRTVGVFAAVIWAFSGYMTGWGQNYVYGGCLLFFTLAMWVLQLFLDRPSRPHFFALSLVFALFILFSWYFFYMSGIFIAFYVLDETLIRGRHVENETPPRQNTFLILIRREFSVLLAALAAICLAAAPLTQILTQFLGSSRTGEVAGMTPAALLQHYDLRTILSSLSRFLSSNLLGAGSSYAGTVDYYNIAFLFTSILLIFALVYLLTVPRTILPTLLFGAASLAMLLFPAAGYILTFNRKAQRHSFLIAFMAVLLIAAFLWSVLREDHPRRLKFSAIAGFLTTLALEAAFWLLFRRLEMHPSLLYFCVTAGSAFIFAVIFLLLGRQERKKALAFACLLAVSLEMVVSGWGTFYDRAYLTTEDYYHSHFNDDTRAAVDRILREDGSLCRISTTEDFSYANEGMVDGFNATTAYAGELPSSVTTLGRTFGIQQYSPNFFLNSWDDYYLLTLLSTRYLVVDEPSASSFAWDSAAYTRRFASDTISVFENANPLPFGYVYTSRIDNGEFEGLSAFDRQRALTQGFLLTEGSEDTVSAKTAAYVPPEKVFDLTERIASANDLTWEVLPDGRLRVQPTGFDPYLTFDISDLYSGGVEALQYFSFTLDPSCLHGMEQYETFITSAVLPDQFIETSFFVGTNAARAAMLLPDGALTLRLDMTAGSDLLFEEISLSQIDDPAADFAALSDSGVSDISFADSTYSAKVTGAAPDSLLCVPILYERSWKATVNGTAAEPVNVNGGLIGIPLTEGDNSVILTYSPPYLVPGIAVSTVSFLLLLLACFLPSKKRKAAETEER